MNKKFLITIGILILIIIDLGGYIVGTNSNHEPKKNPNPKSYQANQLHQ